MRDDEKSTKTLLEHNMNHATIMSILLTAHSRSVCCTAYPSVRLLRLAACATDGFDSAVVVAVAMHPPVCHCK